MLAICVQVSLGASAPSTCVLCDCAWFWATLHLLVELGLACVPSLRLRIITLLCVLATWALGTSRNTDWLLTIVPSKRVVVLHMADILARLAWAQDVLQENGEAD